MKQPIRRTRFGRPKKLEIYIRIEDVDDSDSVGPKIAMLTNEEEEEEQEEEQEDRLFNLRQIKVEEEVLSIKANKHDHNGGT